MSYGEEVTVCTEISKNQINIMWAERTVLE